MQRLREAAEKAKRELDGLGKHGGFSAPSLQPMHPAWHLELPPNKGSSSRVLSMILWLGLLFPCKACLKDSGIDTSELDEVLLVGDAYDAYADRSRRFLWQKTLERCQPR